MLSDNELYIIMKLTSGEQVMAVLKEEDELNIMVDNPMLMKITQVFETGKEHITASPFCAFTNDQTVVISKNNILFIKKLHHVFVPHYQRLVNEHQESTLFTPADSATDESLSWEDEPEETDWEEKLKNFVPGNDTMN
jgi:hypothetical protein